MRPAWCALALACAIAALPPAAADEEYWVTQMPNTSISPTTVVASTTSLVDGTMTVQDRTSLPATYVVPGGGSASFTMGASAHPTGIYYGKALKVTVSDGVFPTYFFPISATAYSNDAGRMVPGSLLGLEHWVYSYVEPTSPGGPGQEPYLVVIATRDGTTVKTTVTGAVAGGGGVPPIPAGGTATFVLDAHDYVLLRSPTDLTGSRVVSDKPVAVYGGNVCAWIGSSACDHISDPILGADLAGREYVHCASAMDRTNGYDLLRVTATTPATTTVTFTPAPAALPGGVMTLAGLGDWDQVEVTEDVRIEADADITIAGYYGKYASGAQGDPAMVVLTPVERWSSLRVFYVPPSWNLHATVAAPTSATLDLDGAALPLTRAIPGTPYSCAHTPLTVGTHRITSSEPVGAHIWATQLYASFWYEASGQMLNSVAWDFDNSHATCEDSAVRFWDSGSATEEGHEVVRWIWDMGDGTIVDGRDPLYTYPEAGTYTVRLTITDDRGVSRGLSKDITAPGDPNCPPTVQGPYERTVRATRTMRMCAQGHDPDNDPLTYTWGPPALPEGVEVDPNGRCITWTPLKSQEGDHGPFRVTVGALGGNATTFLMLHVIDTDGVLPDDRDQDGVSDQQDNCPTVANQEQDDWDRDGQGDACSTPPPGLGSDLPVLPPGATPADLDGDGVADASDVCPETPDPGQADLDGDARGDACDADLDGDGVTQAMVHEAFLDNCPQAHNPSQLDSDSDGQGDACEDTPAPALPTSRPEPTHVPRADTRDASAPAAVLLLLVVVIASRYPHKD